MSNLVQLRLKHTGNNPGNAGNLFQAFLMENNIHNDGFSPSADKNIIIFRFFSEEAKRQVFSIDNLVAKMQEYRLEHISASSPESTDHRTVFVWGLHPGYFWCVTREDDDTLSQDETLDDKRTQLWDDIKRVLPSAEWHKFHKRESRRTKVELPPTTMLIRFKTYKDAETFIDSDTKLALGTIYRRRKKWHQNIHVRQCKLCRDTRHKVGDPNCKGKRLCPRCLSEDHVDVRPNSCQPQCHIHGPGHSSASNLCSRVQEIKRKERQRLDNREKLKSAVAQTPPEQQQFHRDLISAQQSYRSYSAALRQNKSAPGTTRTPPRPPTHPIQPTPGSSSSTLTGELDLQVFGMAYYAACVQESLFPGRFQKTMDEYAKSHNFPAINHPIPPKEVLDAMVSGVKDPPRPEFPPKSTGPETHPNNIELGTPASSSSSAPSAEAPPQDIVPALLGKDTASAVVLDSIQEIPEAQWESVSRSTRSKKGRYYSTDRDDEIYVARMLDAAGTLPVLVSMGPIKDPRLTRNADKLLKGWSLDDDQNFIQIKDLARMLNEASIRVHPTPFEHKRRQYDDIENLTADSIRELDKHPRHREEYVAFFPEEKVKNGGPYNGFDSARLKR